MKTSNGFKHIVFAAVAAMGFVTWGGAAYESELTVAGYKFAKALENFPLLVRISPAQIEGFSYDQVRSQNDIQFSDANGQVLPHEVDTWNPEGESLVWVKVPSLTAGLKLRFGWKLMGETLANAPTAVWGEYVGVWHLGAQETADDKTVYSDSTGNGLTAFDATSATTNCTVVPAVVGNGRFQPGLTLTIPEYSSLAVGGTFTVSGWFNFAKEPTNVSIINHKKSYNEGNGFQMDMSNYYNCFLTASGAKFYNGSPHVSEDVRNRWMHLVLVFDGSKLTVYDNGRVPFTATDAIPADDNTLPLKIGGSAQVSLDDVRLHRKAVSAEWVTAEYNQATDAGFVTASPAKSLTGADILVVSAEPAELGAVSPAYGRLTGLETDETRDCTAPASAIDLASGERYFLVGWQLFAVDAETGAETMVRSSSEGALEGESIQLCKYVHAGQAKLVWLWETREKPAGFEAFGGTAYGCELTVAGYSGATTLEDFPLLVRVSPELIEGFDYGQLDSQDDIAFTDADGRQLPYDVDVWNPEGESLVWVKVPALSAGLKINFGWKLLGTSAKNEPGEVWSGYAGVWHLNEISGVAYADASPNGLDATDAAGTGACETVPAVIGKGRSQAGRALTIPDYSSLGVGDTFTASGWFYCARTQGGEFALFDRKKSYNEGSGWRIIKTGDSAFYCTGSDAVVNLSQSFRKSLIGRWAHLTAVYSGTSLTIYEDGEKLKGYTIIAARDWAKDLLVGGTMDCTLDEVRLSRKAVSADWAKAEYEQATNATGYVTASAARNLTGDDCLLVTGLPGRLGAVEPTYGCVAGLQDGEGVDCTAPEFVPMGDSGLAYVPTGWDLYAVDADAYQTTKLRNSDDGALPGESERLCKYEHEGYAWLVWHWRTACRLTVSAQGGGKVRVDGGEPVEAFDEWVDADSVHTVAAVGTAGLSSFWQGDVDANQQTAAELELTVDGPKNLVARFVAGNPRLWKGGGNGAASADANWVGGVKPTDGDFVVIPASAGSMAWDLTDVSPSGWLQEKGYAGTVTFATTVQGKSFPALTIGGDVTLQGGVWTHKPHGSVQTSYATVDTYRLSVNVGGSLVVGSDAKISATGKGFAWGFGYGFTDKTIAWPYGSVLCPTNCGMSATYASGGGVIRLSVAGPATVDGLIAADGESNGGFSGTGGSIWLTAAKVSGSGTIRADGGAFSGGQAANHGHGGRIAIVQTAAGSVFDASFAVSVSAMAGADLSTGKPGDRSAGTVYLKDGTENAGTLRVASMAGASTATATVLPSGRLCAPGEINKNVMLAIGESAVVKLSQDLAVRDFALSETANRLDLDGHVLTVGSNWHEYVTDRVVNGGTFKDGKRPNWSNVHWRTPGLAIMFY